MRNVVEFFYCIMKNISVKIISHKFSLGNMKTAQKSCIINLFNSLLLFGIYELG